jgi:hypothetical protein
MSRRRSTRNLADRHLRKTGNLNITNMNGGTAAYNIEELHINEAAEEYEDGYDDPTSETLTGKISPVQDEVIRAVCKSENISRSMAARDAMHIWILTRGYRVKLVAYWGMVKNMLDRLP